MSDGGTEPYTEPYTPPPPLWEIAFCGLPAVGLEIVCATEAMDCVGGHAVLSAVYPTSIHTSFFCDGVLTRFYNTQITQIEFSHDPTGGPEDGTVALWPEGSHTHVFHALLYKDIEEHWRFTDLRVLQRP